MSNERRAKSEERRAKSSTLSSLLLLLSAVLVCALVGLPVIPQAADIDLDPSVVLYLPFYKYGSEQQKIWDMSQYGNHGTIVGAVPARIPMLSGVELVSNGNFETDPNVEWVLENATLASVAGGQTGNCLEITRTDGIRQKVAQHPLLIDGKRYKISGWVKSGTSGNEAFKIRDDWWGEIAITGTSSGAWTYYEAFFIHTHGTQFEVVAIKNSATPGTMLFDQVSIQEVVGYTGMGWQFDGVDDLVTVVDSSSLRMGSNNFTILSWIRLDQVTPIDSYVLRKATNGGYGLLVGANSRRLYGIIEDGTHGGSGYLGTSTVPWDDFVFLGMTVNKGTNLANGFINGVSSGAGLDISAVTDPISPTGNLTIMQAGGNYTKGQNGEIAIYNGIALSEQEIRNIYELTRHRYGR